MNTIIQWVLGSVLFIVCGSSFAQQEGVAAADNAFIASLIDSYKLSGTNGFLKQYSLKIGEPEIADLYRQAGVPNCYPKNIAAKTVEAALYVELLDPSIAEKNFGKPLKAYYAEQYQDELEKIERNQDRCPAHAAVEKLAQLSLSVAGSAKVKYLQDLASFVDQADLIQSAQKIVVDDRIKEMIQKAFIEGRSDFLDDSSVYLAPDALEIGGSEVAELYRSAGMLPCYSAKQLARHIQVAIHQKYVQPDRHRRGGGTFKDSYAGELKELDDDLKSTSQTCPSVLGVERAVKAVDEVAAHYQHRAEEMHIEAVKVAEEKAAELESQRRTKRWVYVGVGGALGVAMLFFAILRFALGRAKKTCPSCKSENVEEINRKILSQFDDYEQRNIQGTGYTASMGGSGSGVRHGKPIKTEHTDKRKVRRGKYRITYRCLDCSHEFSENVTLVQRGAWQRGATRRIG